MDRSNHSSSLYALLLMSNKDPLMQPTRETVPNTQVNSDNPQLSPVVETDTTTSASPPEIPESPYKAGYVIFHPERQNILPRFHHLNTFTWKSFVHLTQFGLLSLKSELYLLGGFDQKSQKVKRNIWRYVAEEGRWLFCCKLLDGRCDFTPFIFDGKIFCAGGLGKQKRVLQSVEFFEPMMNVCYYDQDLPFPCYNYGAFNTTRGEAGIVGGIMQTPMGLLTPSRHFLIILKKRVEKEDLTETIEMHWISVENAKFPTTSGVCGIRCVYNPKEDRVYTVGGSSVMDPLNATSNSDNKRLRFFSLHYADMDTIRRGVAAAKAALINSDKASTVSQAVNVWKRRQIAGCQRYGCAVSLIGNKLFVIGGVRQPPSDQWKPTEGSSKNATSIEEASSADVGYYDWKRKVWVDCFPLIGSGLDVSDVRCVLLHPGHNTKEIDGDRMDWLLQWALW